MSTLYPQSIVGHGNFLGPLGLMADVTMTIAQRVGRTILSYPTPPMSQGNGFVLERGVGFSGISAQFLRLVAKMGVKPL